MVMEDELAQENVYFVRIVVRAVVPVALHICMNPKLGSK